MADLRFPWLRRVNHSHQCGADGAERPCKMGPQGKTGAVQCGRYKCSPIQKGNGWICQRPSIWGGACENGPSQDGQCGQTPCKPSWNMRYFRNRVTLWTTLCVLSTIFFLGSSRNAMFWFNPGPLHRVHRFIDQCDQCHQTNGHDLIQIVSSLWSEPGPLMAEKCQNCHFKGDFALSAHNTDPSMLPKKTKTEIELSASKHPLGFKRDEQRQISCENCHREHKGLDIKLTGVSSSQCQTCHQRFFKSFNQGHPDFQEGYGSGRDSVLSFDHISHINKHFPEKSKSKIQCSECHSLERETFFPEFDQCLNCHQGDVRAETTSGLKGMLFLSVPGVDLETLGDLQGLFGEWPSSSDMEWSPFMRFFLTRDPFIREAFQLVDGLDWLDLTSASEAQKKAVAEICRAYKVFLFNFSKKGALSIVSLWETAGQEGRMDGFPLPSPADAEWAVLRWFPNLAADFDLLAANERVSFQKTGEPEPPRAEVKNKEEASDSGLLDDGGDLLDSEDLLSGDSLLDGDDLLLDEDMDLDETGNKPAQSKSEESRKISEEDQVKWGGWFRTEFAVYYRPSGHEDPFLRFWIQWIQERNPSESVDADLARIQKVFDPQMIGRCLKCHQAPLDAPMRWKQKGPVSQLAHFDHRPHILTLASCDTCHKFRSSSTENPGDDKPVEKLTSFETIKKNQCTACHMDSALKSECTLCHFYHRHEKRI